MTLLHGSHTWQSLYEEIYTDEVGLDPIYFCESSYAGQSHNASCANNDDTQVHGSDDLHD